jgi:hypothetical protein
MTETNAPVDAAAPAPASEPSPTPTNKGDAEYWKNEAHNAFEKRNAAKSRVKELEAQLESLSSPQADAGGDMAKQLSAIMAERDGLQSKLESTLKAHREGAIINSLTNQVPEESRRALEILYRSNAAQLDDGEADPAEVIKGADAFLRDLAPNLFKSQAVQKPGSLPNDGGSKAFSVDAERAKTRDALRKRGATGVTL